MATVADCWEYYRAHQLLRTVDPQNNIRFWASLKWFAGLDAESLSPVEVDRYVVSRGDVSPATINRELGMLRAALKFCMVQGLISRVPHIKSMPKTSPAMRALSRDEAAKMLRSAYRWRDKAYVWISLGSGARMSAILDLTWSQVNWRQRIVDFRSLSGHAGRMKGRAIVPFNDTLEAGLKAAKANRDGDYVIQQHGQKLASARRIIERVADNAGLVGVTPHVLRHTVASILLQEGEDILPVSRLLGHANTTITETVYFQHTQEWLRNTSKKLKF